MQFQETGPGMEYAVSGQVLEWSIQFQEEGPGMEYVVSEVRFWSGYKQYTSVLGRVVVYSSGSQVLGWSSHVSRSLVMSGVYSSKSQDLIWSICTSRNQVLEWGAYVSKSQALVWSL